MAEQFQEGEIIFRKGTNERYQIVNGRPQRLPEFNVGAPPADAALPPPPIASPAAPGMADPGRLGRNLGEAAGRGFNRFSQAMDAVQEGGRVVRAALPVARAAMMPQAFNFRPQMPGKESPLSTLGRTPIGRPVAEAVDATREAGRMAGESLARFGQNVASGARSLARRTGEGMAEAAEFVKPLVTAPPLTLTPDQATWYLQQSNGDFDVARMAAEDDGYLWPGE